ncbi:hypothetical protein A3A93_02005 [Candidatus Roizmanbacteria bacterium RIFCSPLOWO2_01_FULL_38_12]|uniref:DUF1648 domain-containing protein n=1 Tax=Candidatus Roizmanbacteria bacterium RIFCSPLOWO2_01_FULL_38_12 TaxID=1802061 RepID=A0A1F7IY09_9BACT|nr:MAG: hypothetical protein A2861_01520 [Candidatus Roizmanbacteria bacterium RIFCSPHIGHO2_01_FULL_38_15]OGK35299.1 MAG: hypothetical protein A3F59_02925 [Candidatus Roizmanbacteria bacterium RIFCSPHIGHO2_12_FULL_38_13]OGK48224.1 MAG: hypothetical protein A3A93_02005 [Candidatus Roizmanbacteria bacterium RIFCSPLOWO2_01_FULL_38_12]
MSKGLKLLIGADVLQLALFAWRFNSLPKQVPLFYSRPWGESQIADIWYIVLLPIMMHLIFFLNSYLNNRFFKEDKLFTRLFAIANYCVIVAFTGIFVKILTLVT